ncbi:MAG: anaerobic ribonucleoside-triphosphate reductase activating protein [Desulfotomaculum sp.]|nr:anaerobic ribonucleoside-triphosphate reductase activating protein [Desulfotomaculum sp.]
MSDTGDIAPLISVTGIEHDSVVNGLGFRTVVFLQGCPRHCRGCHNPESIPFEGGRQMTVWALFQEIIAGITPLTKGITFSGGDPLAQPAALLKIMELLKKERPRLDIWVYTGSVWEEIQSLPVIKPVMQLTDVLVDGPFIEEKKDFSCPFRGSNNQRLINIPETLTAGKIVELNL